MAAATVLGRPSEWRRWRLAADRFVVRIRQSGQRLNSPITLGNRSLARPRPPTPGWPSRAPGTRGTLGASSATAALDARSVKKIAKPVNSYTDALPLTQDHRQRGPVPCARRPPSGPRKANSSRRPSSASTASTTAPTRVNTVTCDDVIPGKVTPRSPASADHARAWSRVPALPPATAREPWSEPSSALCWTARRRSLAQRCSGLSAPGRQPASHSERWLP